MHALRSPIRSAMALLTFGALPAVLLGSFPTVASASPTAGFTPTTVVGDNNPNVERLR